jgi:hypothetical protein
LIGDLRRRLKTLLDTGTGFVAVGETVHVLAIDNSHNITVSVHLTAKSAELALDDYMRSYPDDAWDVQAFSEAMNFDDRVSAYFDENESESYVLEEVPLRDLDPQI